MGSASARTLPYRTKRAAEATKPGRYCYSLLQFPVEFQHDIARFAIDIVNAHSADAVIFVIAFVGKIAADEANV
jgi:hypothetical protein